MEWCKNQYGKDLQQLVSLFKSYDRNKVFKNLDSALNKTIGNLHSRGKNILCIAPPNIEVILKKKIAGTVPHDLKSITIFLDVRSEFDLLKDIDIHDRILDPYNFQIEIKGINDEGECYNAWHLDRDIRKPNSNPPHFDHPLYHFQPGGHRLEGKVITGAVFIGAPRLPHPPMDVILGIHFVLRNFCSTSSYPDFKKLLNDPSYRNILKRAKDRMFTPYFKAFSNPNTHQDFTLGNIFPLAI